MWEPGELGVLRHRLIGILPDRDYCNLFVPISECCKVKKAVKSVVNEIKVVYLNFHLLPLEWAPENLKPVRTAMNRVGW